MDGAATDAAQHLNSAALRRPFHLNEVFVAHSGQTERDLQWVKDRFDEGFPSLLGLRLTEVSPERIVGELDVRPELCTGGGRMHGGALMAFADTLGAVGTVVNLPEGASTTTIESKTNFVAAAPKGERVTGECIPLHRGGTTQVWQTRVTRSDGRLVALVTQTQIVLQPRS